LPGDDRLQTLQRSLEFQHLAPTAPDTLGCFPFADQSDDPFVVRACPHVYFAGNQPRFESTLLTGPNGQRTRVIMVPDFQKEHTCVLVNLETLDCRPMNFGGLDAFRDDEGDVDAAADAAPADADADVADADAAGAAADADAAAGADADAADDMQQ
jgi:DNA polymerase delta subunit 2